MMKPTPGLRKLVDFDFIRKSTNWRTCAQEDWEFFETENCNGEIVMVFKLRRCDRTISDFRKTKLVYVLTSCWKDRGSTS